MVDYTKEKKNDHTIYKIKGEFVIGQIGDILEDYTDEIKSNQSKFIFDFTNVELLDSSGLGTILMGATQVMNANEKIKICLDVNNTAVKDLFSIVKLDTIMDYYPSINDALEGKNNIKI
jgi:anti-anti-sigma factor